MSGALIYRHDNTVMFYSCKTGCTFLTKCPRCHQGSCNCAGQFTRFGENYRMGEHDLENMSTYLAVVRDPVERAISAFQHTILRLYFPDRREKFLSGGDTHWLHGELPTVQAWRSRHESQLERYLTGDHPDDIVALYEDFAETVLPKLKVYNCHFQPQLHHSYTQEHLHRCELIPTGKLTNRMSELYPQWNWNRRSTHNGGWYFNISRKRFYQGIVNTVAQHYPNCVELWDRCVEETAHKYPGLQKTRLNTICY